MALYGLFSFAYIFEFLPLNATLELNLLIAFDKVGVIAVYLSCWFEVFLAGLFFLGWAIVFLIAVFLSYVSILVYAITWKFVTDFCKIVWAIFFYLEFLPDLAVRGGVLFVYGLSFFVLWVVNLIGCWCASSGYGTSLLISGTEEVTLALDSIISWSILFNTPS